MRVGVPGDPLHDVLVAIHFELVGNRRVGERRRAERRRETSGMAGARGLDRRVGERRAGADRRRSVVVPRSAVRLIAASRAA